VGEETAVLDRHRRVAHDLGDVLGGQRRAQHVGLDEAEARLAVGGVDDRRRALVLRLEVAQRRPGGRDAHDVADRGQPADRHAHREDPEGQPQDLAGTAAAAALAALASKA
jgi:hypothetical protein